MNQKEKSTLHSKAKHHLAGVINNTNRYLRKIKEDNQRIREDLPKANEDNKIVQQRLLEYGKKRVQELETLAPSPYFIRCVVAFDGEEDDMYFGKFSLSEEAIYSWVTPAASIRFNKPGTVSYTRPNGELRTGVLKQKDQYMISDGKIVFLSTESVDEGRVLVYQEYFSTQKKGFILPEIVAQMEQAQDRVIRANHRGPLLISGPAGSGKTTLALHRVAYLAQSPDVSEKFPPSSIIVFVQDEGTKEYFSHLLPELGIKGVTITTFASWAMRILDIEDHQYVSRLGNSEKEKDLYEYKKRLAIHRAKSTVLHADIYTSLEQLYGDFSEKEKNLLDKQKENKQLDRFDLTALLLLFKKTHGKLTLMQEYYQMAKSGAAKKKVGRFPVKYSLMIFDEFQNYMPEQILLGKSTLDEAYNAVMYVGDMAQQTQLGTIQTWEEAGEHVKKERSVMLQKVYRNTKHILKYIQDIGYDIHIPESIKEGTPVVEKIVNTKQEEIAYIQSLIQADTGSIGILAKDKSYLEDFVSLSDQNAQIHLMSMNEAQGVEFDMVCIVGVSKDMIAIDHTLEYEKLSIEKKRTNKDLLYVALTRAITSLHIIGNCSLKEALHNAIR